MSLPTIFRLLDNSKKLVLYHAVSSYQLLEVILHRMTFHKDELAVLILPDFILSKYPKIKKLCRLFFFDDLCLFPYTFIPHTGEDKIINAVDYSFEKYIPYDISDFSEIYVAGAHFYFSLYLIKHGIPFSFFEDAAGLLSHPEKLSEPLKLKYPVHAKIAENNGLFSGENKLIKEIICLKSAQSNTFLNAHRYDNRLFDFSVEDALEKLDEKRKTKLIKFFLPKKITTDANAVLLTQHFSNLGIMSVSEQEALYRNLSETLLNNISLIIKPHPDDKLDYSKIFKGVQIIDTVFPSELLPYAFYKKPEYIYSFSSSGCENLKKHFTVIKIDKGGIL